MNTIIILRNIFIKIFIALLVGLFTTTSLSGQITITHNIGTQGSFTIPGNSINNYIITGTTTTNKVIIQPGYRGTVTLSNVDITSSTSATNDGRSGVSCITVEGEFSRSNLDPITNVNIILDGTNKLTFTQQSYCALQVNQGAQIHIRAIDPFDNASGTLEAKCTYAATGSTGGGAAIGAPNFPSGGTITPTNCQGSSISSCNGTAIKTAGGNIIVDSGTITAQGSHGAGIGGGWYTYYNGIIIVTGGIIDASVGRHAAGLGSGCPTGTGVITCYAENSAIIALPPCVISATGRVAETSPPDPTLGLNGTKTIIYVNDPAKPLHTIRTEDYMANANIYLDLTETPGLEDFFNAIYPEFNLTKVWIGRTNLSGIINLHGIFQNPTTFFTDASSTHPDYLGRPYLPVTTTTEPTVAKEIVLPLLPVDLVFTDILSIPLEVGYSASDALDNSFRLKIEYFDALPLTSITYQLQDQLHFSQMIFYAADGVTEIPPPTSISQGDVFYISLPLNVGKPLGYYDDVLLIGAAYQGNPLPGYLRRIGKQRVAFDDSYTNDYLCVSVDRPLFTAYYPSTDIATLILNINHTGMNATPYEPQTVVARYMVTTESNFDVVLAGNPIHTWPSLNIPLSNNANTTTEVSFSDLPLGIYYIHWYVESGVAYAHSLDVVSPPSTCGGFGPYTIALPIDPGEISSDKQFICSGETVAFTGTAGSGGSGTLTYKWQSSPNGTSWTDIPSSNIQHYTTGALTSNTYFRRQTSDAYLTVNSNVILITISPSEMYWRVPVSDNNWNNPLNWGNQLGMILEALPASCTDVHIPGNAEYYPSLDESSTPRTIYGPPVCDKIYFHFGGEVAKPHLLTYSKAFVEYNFGYFDPTGTTYYTGGDSHSTTPMKRGQWYALAAPLKKITPGDFSFGGKPDAWQQAFIRNNTAGVFAGQWAEPHNANATDIASAQYNGIAVWMANVSPGIIGEDASFHVNLNALHGVIRMPYFEDSYLSGQHRIHQYIGGESRFFYYDEQDWDQPIASRYDALLRGGESYRFVFDGNLQSTTINGEAYPTYRLTVPAGQELMIGNPFLSNLDFDMFWEINQSNLENKTYRLYVDNNWGHQYTVGSGGTGSPALTRYIAPLQAFFIQTKGSGTIDLLFPPDLASVTMPANKLRAAAGGEDVYDNVLYVEIANSAGSSWATLGMKEGINVDQLFNDNELYAHVPQVYFSDRGSKNGVQFISGAAEVSIGVRSQDTGKNILRFRNVDRFDVESLVLYDKVSGVAYSLQHGVDEIMFNNMPDFPDRFLLQVGTVTSGAVTAKDTGVQFRIDGQKLIVAAVDIIQRVTVTNIQGITLFNYPSVNDRSFSTDMNVPSGIYLVNITLENGESRVGKVIVW